MPRGSHKVLGIVGIALGSQLSVASAQPTAEDYRRAERFLPANIGELFRPVTVEPTWLADGNRFWYRKTTGNGTHQFVLVDPIRGTIGPAFDHARLGAALRHASGVAASRPGLPFDTLTVLEPGTTLVVPIDTTYWRCDLIEYTCVDGGRAPARDGSESLSPDGSRIAFVADHNLQVRTRVGGAVAALTHDGSPSVWYGVGVPSPLAAARPGTLGARNPILAVWSPDSRRVASYRVDTRRAKRLALLQSARPDSAIRPATYEYLYHLPGDSIGMTAQLVIFDVETARHIEVQLPPIPVLYYGFSPTRPADHWWSADGRRLYVVRWQHQRVEIAEVDPTDGTARIVMVDESPTFLERYYQRTDVSASADEVMWPSERDGWRHLYRFDKRTGGVRSQITRGSWAVREVLRVDWQSGWVYFTAGGREAGRDPYYRHLYRVRLDGSAPEVLTPEPADHYVVLSPSGRYVVDTYGTITSAARSVVRSSANGRIVMELGTADLAGLEQTGWAPPRPIQVKARDGMTDLYGILVLPTNFDSTKRYPIIDFIYAGPQVIVTPKTLEAAARLWQSQALAELGFVVVIVDGMGTPFRSKPFHDVTYRNLGDAGLLDHMGAVRQLAARHAFIDTTRVGVFGISAGGYASTHAILSYPDFYTVAVSHAGNHDHRLDKSSWVERYMGAFGPHYREQANPTLAKYLKGKLLLTHGDMDENVPVASTLVLVDALISAGKDFDLLIVPNLTHAWNPYVIRKKWDYFVRHLLGVEPPPREVAGSGSR